MVVEGINLDEFEIKFVQESHLPYCDFAIVIGYESDPNGSISLHVARDEISRINGLIANIDRIRKEAEENGHY